jgi:hypothetical protein
VAPGVTTVLPLFVQGPDEAALSSLRRAIESVLSQDTGLVPHELLIVDDGSDPPAEKLPVLQDLMRRDARIRLVRLSRNRGLSYALNAGLTQARYDLIARIDADDRWRPGKLARQLEMLAADPDLTLVGSSMRLVHADKPELDRDELRGGDWVHALDLSRRIGCPFPHGSILGRRQVFERLGGYPQGAQFEHSEDFALWAQWIRFYKVAICGEVFLDYSVSDGQISSRFQNEQCQAGLAASATLDVLGNGDLSRVPRAVASLAAALGIDLTSTSDALFTAWRFHNYVLTDPDLYDDVLTLLPDRTVHRCEDVDVLLADRFFHFSKAQFDRARFPGARHVRTLKDLRRGKP